MTRAAPSAAGTPARRRSLLVVASLVCTALVTVIATPSAPAAAIAPRAHRVMLVTDSVGLGTRGVLDDFFPADWDVDVIGKPASFVGQLESNFVRPNLFRTGDHVVIAGGYNYPFWDPARFEREVDSIISTLTEAGVAHVYWVTLREVKPQYISPSAWQQVQKYSWYFPTVNQHLERALARHPQLTLIDWAAVADRPGITYDAIHLNPTGAALYSSLISRAVNDARTRPPNEGVTRINVATPAAVAAGDVAAVSVNLTSVRGRTRGYLSAFPCEQGSSPSSNLNHRRDQTVAAAAIVPVGPSGDICVFNQQAGHVIVDVFGRFGRDAELESIASRRVLDTRNGPARLQPAGVERDVAVGAPDRIVALNVTVTQAAATGYLTVHECGAATTTSNVNFLAGPATPNLVLTRTGSDGRVCVTTTQNAHVIVDVLAEFGPSTTVDALDAQRIADTRGGDAPVAGQTVRIPVPADGPVAGNLTITAARAAGYATVFPCRAGRPATSNVNYDAGTAIANAVIVEPDEDAMLCVYTSSAADVVFDLLATTGAGFAGSVPDRVLDTRTP